MLYLGFSIQIEEQNVRKLHNLFRSTDICRLDCTQVQSSPESCIREWPAPDAAGEGTRESVQVVFSQVGKTSNFQLLLLLLCGDLFSFYSTKIKEMSTSDFRYHCPKH